jgi:hypothetical protein
MFLHMLGVYIHAACSCPCCKFMDMLHIPVHAACPCPCCMPLSMVHAHALLHEHGHIA